MSNYDRPTRTHRVVVTFEMEEMTGTPEESAEVLLDLYVADEVTVTSVVAYDPRLVAHGGDVAAIIDRQHLALLTVPRWGEAPK
jgi:hypothetical protein